MHSPIPGAGTSGIVLSGLSFLAAPGIGLFIMISGALLLDNNLSQKDFLKRRFSKILYPTLIWTFIYLINKFIAESVSACDVIKSILSVPFSEQGHGVLWFMYTLAGLYLLTPVLSKWIQNATRNEVRFYLLVWGISLLYPYLSLYLDVKTEYTGILYYFSGYVGYFVLGYYLRKWIINQEKVFNLHLLCWAAIVLCILIVGFIKLIYPNLSIGVFFWYLSLPVAIMSTSYFILLGNVQIVHSKNLIISLSKLSFGVYLIHILIMRTLLWNISFISNSGPYLHILIVAVLTIFISWLFSWIISKLSISKYLIGI